MTSNGSKSSDLPSSKRECNYGENCYRRNPHHFKEFRHSHLEKMLENQLDGDIKLPNSLKATFDRAVILEQLKILAPILKVERIKRDTETRTPAVKNEGGKKLAVNTNEGKESTSSSVERSRSKIESPVKVHKEDNTATAGEPEYKKRKTNASSSGGFLKKWEDSLPYNFFLTTIQSAPRTKMESLSITFSELLDDSLGNLESSLQINFMIELEWLLYNYHIKGKRERPLLILYGVEDDALKDKSLLKNNVKAVHVKPPHPFGHHHTKMCLFRYDDGSVRVVVHTANLIESDWLNRTQGVWVGPRCPPLPADANSAAGESPSNFRMDLIRYLSSYRLSCLTDWIGILRKTDFSSVKVCFVSSSPGSHKGPDIKYWGHMKVGQLLRSYASSECRGEGHISPWPLIIQCSSIGSLGAESSTWMGGEFRSSLSETAGGSKVPSIIPNLKIPTVKVIYPSLKNVSQSHDGLIGGACLPYSMKTHVKQTWLSGFLHQWKSEERYRSQAVPHIKTYTRWCPGNNLGRLGWFILTSANLSKAAWGSLNKNGSSLYIMSYEAGVLFLPHFFLSEHERGIPDDEVFPVSKEDGQPLPPFPLPYDLPLSPYGPGDKVWHVEYLT